MLTLPLAVPVPETDTDVVELEVGVVAVLVALADWAIALLAANISPSDNNAAIECEIFMILLSNYTRDTAHGMPWWKFRQARICATAIETAATRELAINQCNLLVIGRIQSTTICVG